MSALEDILDPGLAALELSLEPAQRQQLLDLVALLETWAPRFNLTGHRSGPDMLRRLVLDALALERELPVAQRIADLGAGAGFPGLPLAIVRPAANVLLVESRERRHHFQRAAIRALGLRNVRPLRGRIESLTPERCDGVVAQALARPRAAIVLGLAWCKPGGWIAVPGAEEAPAPGPLEAIRASQTRAYTVPCGGPRRTLWLARRG